MEDSVKAEFLVCFVGAIGFGVWQSSFGASIFMFAVFVLVFILVEEIGK